MNSIENKIRIIAQAKVSKEIFLNDDIAQKVDTKFECCNCGSDIKIEITPYESGFPVFQIYNESQVLSKSELLENKMLSETSPWMQHYGELTFNDLPTLYFASLCQNCGSNFIVIFGFGEKQPGMTMLQISGVWQYSVK